MNKEPYINERRKQIQLAVEKFVSLIRDVNGVIEIALFGSAASDKAVPKDFDLRERHLSESRSLSGSIRRRMKV